VQLRGDDGWFASVDADAAPDGYTVKAAIPIFGDIPGGLTENRLRAAAPATQLRSRPSIPASRQALGPNALACLPG